MVEGHVEQVAREPPGHIHVGETLHLRVGAPQAPREDGHQVARNTRARRQHVVEVGPFDHHQLDLGDGDDRGGARCGLEQTHFAEDLARAEHGQNEFLAIGGRGDDLDPTVDNDEDRVGVVALVKYRRIGREFLETLVAAVSELSESALAEAFNGLTEAGLVHSHGTSETTFVFKHALVRDAAGGAA